jgi:abortive infection bacteriophage resistance protein
MASLDEGVVSLNSLRLVALCNIIENICVHFSSIKNKDSLHIIQQIIYTINTDTKNFPLFYFCIMKFFANICQKPTYTI